MKKKFVRLISAVLSAAMTLTAVPLSAFAEGEAHTHDGESNIITTPLDFREKKADENGVGWSWDYDTKTLTLDGVNIQATTDSMSVVTVPDGTEIVLKGENTIVQTNTGESYTYVLSAVNTDTTNCDGTMTISGEGVLNAENRSTDSMARSLGGSIILNGGTVNATGTVKTDSLEIHNDGVLNANASATSYDGAAVNVSGSITVDGNGSLNAVGCAIENQDIMNTAILLNGNKDSKISVTGNGSITVPESNGARYGICYDVDRRRINAEISGKVTAYGTMCGISGINLIMSGTGSVYATGDILGIDNTDPSIDEDEFVIKGSTEYKAEESAVTGEVTLYGVYYKIGEAYAKTVVIKPDTSLRIILGKQTGIFKTEEYEIIEDMTDIKLKGTVYFDITLKNMSDEEFADARGYFGGDEPDLSASIIKTDYGWVCMVCDTEFSVTYDTDNTLTIKCGDIVSNTVQVKSNANRFNKVTQGDNTNRTVFYTNTSQEEKDNYKLVSTYTVDSESISYNWYSTNSAYSADELGAAVSGTGGEFKLADNIPAGNYVLYCDITYSDGDSTETVTEKFTFTYKECAHENGYSDGKCTNCGALCDHSNIDIDTGKCNECERQFVATISTDGSAPTGYDTLKDCLNSITADTGNYVKIYQDIGDEAANTDTIDVNHNVMIDLNGHKLNNIKLGVNKDVKLALTGTVGSYVMQVYVRNGGSFVIDSDANAGFNTIFVEADAGLAVNDGAKVTTEQLTVIASVADDGTTTTSVKLATGMKIGALSYHCQNNSEVVKLGNLLDVTRQALQRDDNGEYLDLYKEYGGMGYPFAFTVVEHTDADHKYGSGTGKCKECGKPCEHSGDINTDNGICSICGAVVSVAIYTDANGISKYVDADELHSLLNEYNGSGTVKLFKDYNNSKAQYDLYGELTIDLNGRQFNIRSITPCKNGKLTIKNSGNPVMLGCNVYPTSDPSYAGGTLIIDGDVVLDTSIYVYDSSTVILKDGTYTGGLYARDSKTLYDMLGEGKAFFKADGTLFNASVKEISSDVTLIVKDHSHTYVDGECDCGYVCPHSNVDSETGKCTECEYQYAAVIVKDGAAASVYKETEMEAAFEAADSEANTGCTLRVYKNYTDSYTTLSGKFTLWIAEKANVGALTVSGDITVTGSIKNNSFYGNFDVAAGGKLTFDENCGAMGTVSVGAGTFDCYRSLGTTLNINDASSDVILHGGYFIKIRYNGGGDRANAEILTLLAENRMFMTRSNDPIDGSKTLLKDGFATTVLVIPHEDHGYDSTTGKCKICGKRCGHTDVDSETGVCPTCKYQLTASISGVGTAKYFDNIDDAFTAALSAENSGCTLTLYKDCELSQNIVIGNATVTVDMNGHSILLAYRIKVNDGGVLYLKNSGENGSIETEIDVNKGGTLINGTADDSRSAVSVFGVTADAAKRVEIYGGSYEGLTVNNGTSGIALYGGSYESINTNDLTDSTPVSALLAKGYAFATLNSVTHLPESIVDGSETNLNPGLENVMVVAHTHTYTETNPKCACGAVLYAKVTSADGTSNKYFDSIEEGLLYADKAENKGCVFTLVARGLLKDKVTLSSGQFTIATATTNNTYVIGPYEGEITIDGADVIAEGDLAFRCNVCVESGSLTLPEGSGTGFDSIIISGGTVTISEGVNADSYAGADNLSVDKDATDVKLTIGGGTYGNVYFGQLKLKDVLASGVRVISYDNPSDPTAEKTAMALLYSDIAEESSLNSNNGTVSYYLFTKCDHKNEDGSYAFNEGGICKYCNSEFAASVSYTDGGSEKTELFGDIIDAFDKANEVGTATVTLYKDIENDITDTIAVTGNVTLELNGKKLTTPGFEPYYAIEVKSGKLTVNGSGSIKRAVVRNGGDAEINGGTFSDFRIEDGGNAVINGGKFNSIKVSGEGRNVGQLLADGYAYKNFDGFWSTVAEREKQGIASVNVLEAPIKSASIAWVGEEAPVIYRNGDKYLYVNITYELAVGSRGATYSDFVNGNNRIKDYNLYNKYMVHCYEIGKLAAKDGEVEYYTVLKCNGYEYKSNVLKLTLATCSHPKDSFSYENNGLVICGICDALIEAEVVDADGKSLGYADIESAIKLAQENEGSTVKLMSDGVSSATEFTTVTGGKFTVDFNGKMVFYQFAVSGGDVTFTSSVKQDDVENLISEITVNGADAKVTIDGKIKLGIVRTLSGTLTINSTDSYIETLSIEGAKTDIDGARIGALNTFGGEAVIKNVTADSLAMCDNRSGGSKYNISIVSGRFGSFTCNADSGYNIVKALASERRLRGTESGIIYEYSEIESLTEATDITVEKCDHKYANGNIAVDDDYVCYYCNSQIIATVSYTADGSEKTDLFGDIYDAFERANEAGTATVTLQKNITDDITDTIAVTGNVTLELNGKTLGSTFAFIAPVEVSDGGMFTVGGDGKMRMPIKAYANSKLIVGGGEFTSVMVYIDGDAEIGGGVIDALTIIGNAKAKISGGKFYNIEIANGSLESVLADGYAYKKDGGAWLSIAERAESVYSGVNNDNKPVNVEEAPIKSATITANDESPIIYRNGNNSVDYTANVTYTGNETLYVTRCLIDGTVIREKTIFNGHCELCSGEVDKAVAEDGEIQYYCIFTYDGYEYKSNVVTLTVATCQHPVESVKCDDNGNYVCGICNRTLPASVELSDGTLSYYGKWNDAISTAQESEGCTLKLLSYSELKNNETFDISKGRFTVDLNKNDSSGPFAFNVKGGDITFTALKKASISFTGVTVSGENANVLIDSKATLNYLVVNSGKVSADGAYIGIITIKGGDMVINDVDTGLLSKEGNGSVNISIVSGRFESVVFDEYTFGKAIASGSRIRLTDADGGKIYKYADIQNKGNAGVIVVEKCDHKDENDSYALDGNPCPYCNEEIAATVSYMAYGSETTDLFSDIYDAFAKANEVGTATITLYKDIENSEFTRYITVTGNVTLALNGKKLGYSFVSRTVEVSDGGMLTVDGDGKMMVPIIVNENAKLTVNGGEIATVMIYKDGDAVIGGGFIEDLDVNGNVKLSGGKFYNIEIANGSLESILADGYAYKVDGGAWLSIAERAKEKYYSWNNEDKPVNVEEAPIKSATLSTEINKLYRNSNANPTLKFILALAVDTNQNDSDVRMRYGINSYECGDTVYSSLRVLLNNAKLSADKIIDKAGDSDAAKIYFVVTTGDGYEIKSNAVSIDLVDCDHSQVVDPTADKETAGNITTPTYCEICESKFNAKITKGDDVRYYNDLDEAAKDAQKSENEGCTLYPLYNKNGYGGQLVITEGNFTLKYAVRTAFSRPIIINGKAKLTVTGRCAVTSSENPDAFTVDGGNVTFDGLATGSNVTINGGNVTMAANNINCLTINGGNVSISSGGFAEIVTTVSDKVIADYIDHGFWVQDRGTKEWIDIYSLNKATASSTNVLSVRVCPMQIIQPRNNVYYTNGYYPGDIPSLQINAEPWYSNEVDANVAYQWIAIDENGNETEIEGATGRKLSLENLTTGRYYCRLTYSNAATAGVSMASNVVTATITECEHSGGKATCTEKAKCEICGAEYGEMKPHSYAHIKAPEYLKSAATCTAKAVYYTSCTECGLSSEGTADEATFEYGNALGHSFGEWSSTAPTCTKDGSRVRKCSRCDKIETEVIPATGHKYVDTVIKPTYTEKGYTLHKCSRCGSSYKDSYTNVLVLAKISGLKTVSRTDTTAKISWNKNPNADGYIIEQYNGSRWMLIARITSNSTVSFTAKTLVAGSTNKLRARAYKGTVYSAYTYININTAPSAITGFTLKNATSSTLNVAWDRNTSGDGYILDKYDGSKWVTVAKVTNHATLNNTANNLKAGTSYKFRIRAYKVFGSVTVYGSYTYLTAGTKPAAMSGIKVKSKTNLTASLQWNKNISADGYVLDKYDGSKWVTIKTLTSNTDTSFNVTGLKASTTFKFRLRAYKNYGTAKEYSEFTYFTVNTRPYTTTGMKCNSKTNLTANLQWNKNISADGYVLDKYDGTKWVTIKTFTSNANTSFNVTGLRASTTFNFRLRAYKNFDNGKVYSEFTYLNVNTRPYTTTGFKMKSATKNSVTLQWNKNISANGYCIEKWDGSKWVQVKRYTSNANVTYTATGLKADTAYKFRIRAYKTIGNVNEYSAYSAVVTARTKK